MRYRDGWTAGGGGPAHAVPIEAPGTTACGLDTVLVRQGSDDWELGTRRTKCPDCVVVVDHVLATVAGSLTPWDLADRPRRPSFRGAVLP